MSKIADVFDEYSSNISSLGILQPLIDDLRVTADSIHRLGVGINPLTGGYVYPERDDQGCIIGLAQRFLNGTKGFIKGGKRGLIYPLNPKFEGVNYVSGEHNWERVCSAIPCPICGKSDGCLVPAGNPPDPGAVVCVHISKGSAKALELGYLHILKSDMDFRDSAKRGLLDTKGPIIVTEGYSDTASALDLGFVAVGKPSAECGNKFLPALLRGRDVIIVGDNDAGVGETGMESTFETLKKVCKSIVKVLPPSQYKDLRQWKNQVSLTKTSFLEWVLECGESSGDPNILPDDSPSTIAKAWLDQEKTQDGLPTIRCYHGQWIRYVNGNYTECDKEEFRGSIYEFLDGKIYPKVGVQKGEVTLVPYRSTRSKVSDIVDALSQWCPLVEDPPIWLKDTGKPDPADLIAFENGLLDVNEYVNGRIKLYDPTPALFSFNVLPYKFNEDSWSDIWEQFYEEIFNGDEKQIELLAQWFGYNCVSDMSYEKLMLCTGRPRSGKGTVLNTLAAMLGRKQCVSTSFQTLCTEFGYQPLLGKLAVLLSDAKVPREQEAKAALEKILQIVGGDPIGVRRMYLPYLPQIYPKCRFTIAMNSLPNLPDQANALEPKLNILYFQNSYEGIEDLSLKRRLTQDARDGKIINFALQGLRSLREAKRFVVPDSSKELIRQLREITTPIASFITECCETEPPGTLPQDEYYVLADQLYEVWSQWCLKSGRKPSYKAQFGQWFLAAYPSAVPARIRLEKEGGSTQRHAIYRKVRLAEWVCHEYLGVNR